LCNGLTIPLVAFDQIYSFDVDALIAAIPRPEQITEERFRAAADNAGATDEHRALNGELLRPDCG